ncbi:hypothetical protein SELMODRAFT_421470 [Selaginella moellendorffii]|uniref:Pectinesterase inhibitor domain-containing protein n=1 Tax=Selaginella moellendorffii TaxID=88036 RepID=D8SFD5_SELML|nr:hypothetical protein SELMODRAFT_421470 [Selaginella moellendorffii]
MASILPSVLAMLVMISLVSSCTADSYTSGNITKDFITIQQKLQYCNKTYPQASAFLSPLIDYAGLGTTGSPPSFIDVLRGIIALLDDFLFANFGSTPTLPPGFSSCLQEVIDKLLCLLYSTTGTYRILVSFLLASVYLVKGILVP